MVLIALFGGVVVSLGCVYWFKPSLFYIAYMRFSRWNAGVQRKQCLVGRVTWAYSERGQASPHSATLLLVHGYSAASDSWNWVIRNLPGNIHIVAVDLPGHGDTLADPSESMDHPVDYYAESLKGLVDQIGLEKQALHLAGVSMGGTVVGRYAVKYPSLVKQVSFICPGFETPIPSKMVLDEAKPGMNSVLIPETPEDTLKMLNSYVVHKPMRFPKQFMKGMLDARRKYEPFMKLLKERFERPENKGDLNRDMIHVTAPSHIVWGVHDNIVHVSGAEVLKENLPNLQQYDIFEECGHAIDLEDGKKLAQRLALFWVTYNPKE